MEKTPEKITRALRTLGILQALSGLVVICAILLFLSHETLDTVGEDIMMPGQAIQIIAIFLMSLVGSSGVLALMKLRWGWLWSFTVATVFLTMALLMGPGTIPFVKWSFLASLALTLLNWATAVVYYFQDLYS